MHLADAFIQSDLLCIQVTVLHFISSFISSILHWLPTKLCIDFKILLITYKALNGLAPQYLSELLLHYSPPRPLRSQNLPFDNT